MKKQAVVLVHGIGEQRPMDTVREFVKSVWVKDKALDNTRYWNKPSEISGSFEHRRLTTDYATIKGQNKQTSRVDFYEYYWAHHTVGTSTEHLKAWLFSVLLRKPSDFPKPLQRLLFLVWFLIAAIFALTWFIADPLNQSSMTAPDVSKSLLVSLIKPLIVIVLSALLVKIVSYLGDVARYVMASPSNIRVRQAIRDGGVDLLKNIAATGKYDRIVLVGHSLGSIIAYDVLTQYWAQNNKFKNVQGEPLELSKPALTLIEKMETLSVEEECEEYQRLQYALFRQLQLDCADVENDRAAHCPWLISDLVTIGSPLTYADFLLFKHAQEFTDRKLDRQYPTLPPVKENGHYTYQTGERKYLHHSAVFCLTRWTNIYSKPFWVFGGDIVSGPVENAFSAPYSCGKTQSEKTNGLLPIKDIDVEAAFPGLFPRLFTHTHYWRWHPEFEKKLPEHIVVLQDSLDLKRKRSPN
ncbi:hypothetical protein [Aliiglaciecola litoralis]|uniref:Uncharacterized protein n=1 Tax=Aliiglaciecola litoralis TaxID=582857 RepID=A0ABP3WQY0_9ALTE